MAVDLNMDMGAIIKGLLNKKSGDSSSASMGSNDDIVAKIKPFAGAIGLFLTTVILFVLYYNLYYTPMVQANLKKEEQIKKLENLKSQTATLEQKIASIKKTLVDSKDTYLESLSHFGNSEDLGELYRSVSTLAAKYGLTVLNIKELGTTSNMDAPKGMKPEEAAKLPKPQTEVKEIQVEAELKGPYSEYIKFKEDLAIAEMLLKVNSEDIKVKSDKSDQGNIFATLNLSTYAIDKKPFQKVMEDEEGKGDEK